MKIKISIISLTTIFALAITSCKKGDTGPAGPQGPSGKNSVLTTNYSVSQSTWVNGSSCWYVDLGVSALNSKAQDSAAVEVFLSTNGGTTWVDLPYTFVNSTNYFMGFTTNTNQVEIQWTYNGVGNGSDPCTALQISTCKFKVVVIPSGMVKPNVNPHNYNEVKQAYGLKD
jgi:hypothetical protein